MKTLELERLGLTELNFIENHKINGGDILAWWEALGDAIGAMNRARDEYSMNQATSLYQSLILAGREAAIW